MEFENMVTLDHERRIATVEEKVHQQEKFNASICEIVTSMQKHFRKIELILVGALVMFGVERAAVIMQIIPGGLP